MKINNFNDLFFFAQSEALSSITDQTPEYVYRKICRIYSKEFNTPLHVVYQLPARMVILNVLEDRFEQLEDEDFMEYVVRTIDPEIDAKSDQELDEWIRQIEAEEENKRKGRDNTKSAVPTPHINGDHGLKDQKSVKRHVKRYDFSDEERQIINETNYDGGEIE